MYTGLTLPLLCCILTYNLACGDGVRKLFELGLVSNSVKSGLYSRAIKDSECPVGRVPIAYINLERQFERRAQIEVSLNGCKETLTRIPAVDAGNLTDLLTRWPSREYMEATIILKREAESPFAQPLPDKPLLYLPNATLDGVIEEYLRVRGGRSRGEAALVFGHTYAVRHLYLNTNSQYGLSVEDDAMLSITRLHFHTMYKAFEQMDGPFSRTPEWAVAQLFLNGGDQQMIDEMKNYDLLFDSSVTAISRWGTVALAYNREGMKFQLERQMDKDYKLPRCPMDIMPCVADLALRKQRLMVPPWSYNRLIEHDSGLRAFKNTDGRAHEARKTNRHHRLAARNIQLAFRHFELSQFAAATLFRLIGAENLSDRAKRSPLESWAADRRALYRVLELSRRLILEPNSAAAGTDWYRQWVRLMTHNQTPKMIWDI